MITVASLTDARLASYYLRLLETEGIDVQILEPAPSVFQISVPEDQADAAGALITSTGYMACMARRPSKLGSVKDWPDTGWDRFLQWAGIHTWDEIVECGIGDPSEKESKAICLYGYYGEQITKKSVEGLKEKEHFKPPTDYRVRVTHPDEPGMVERYFKTKEEMVLYARERGGGDPEHSTPSSCSWINDVGSRIEVDGASCLEVFPEYRA